MKKYVLVFTDGYSIQHRQFDNYSNAYDAMKEEYELRVTSMQSSLLPNAMESSYLDNFNAELHTGYDLYLWDIITVR